MSGRHELYQVMKDQNLKIQLLRVLMIHASRACKISSCQKAPATSRYLPMSLIISPPSCTSTLPHEYMWSQHLLPVTYNRQSPRVLRLSRARGQGAQQCSFTSMWILVSTPAPMQYQDTTLLCSHDEHRSSRGEEGRLSVSSCHGVSRLFQDGPQLGRGALSRAVGEVKD